MAIPRSELACRVAETIAKYRMLALEERVLVGVSGGADSVSLVRVLKELGYSLGIGHLNHGLRGADSDGDEQFVRELASQMGIPVFARRVAIQPADGNIEAAGRAARKEFFASICRDHGFSKIAIAHTRDDRVETSLLHLIRGAGLEGIVSMAPVTGSTVRPMIESTHEEIQRFLLSVNQPWRTDATNLDTSFSRNRLRHQVIPNLEGSFNPRFRETLSRTIELLQDDEDWMRKLTEEWLAARASPSGDGVVVEATALRNAPVALARRAIRLALRQSGSDLADVTFERIESIRTLLEEGKSGKTIQVPGQIVAERSFDKLIIRHIQPPVREFVYELTIPGTVHIPELGRSFRAGLAENALMPNGSMSRERVFVDGGSLGPCVKIRNWKPGDYYKPVGWPGGKLKKLFQRAGVPRSQRNRWPVFEIDSTIVWVASFPVSREFAPSGRSQKIVALEALSD